MNFIPESPNTFQGNQVIINSDRLVFNAKKEAILLYSDKAIGFSTNGNFHFDTDNSEDTKFIINAPNRYLGLNNLRTGELPTEPAVLGHELQSLLTQILDLFDNFIEALEEQNLDISMILCTFFRNYKSMILRSDFTFARF